MQKPERLAAFGFSKPTLKRPQHMSEHDCTTPARPELTAEHLRSILNYNPETGVFIRKISTARLAKVGDVAGTLRLDGYVGIKVQGRAYKAHRLAWLHFHGAWPVDQLDHINRIRTDNRIANLREVTHKQNGQNRSKPSNNTSGHPGVCWFKPVSKWQAYITHNQKNLHLGYFTDIEEALSARKAAEKLYWADTQ